MKMLSRGRKAILRKLVNYAGRPVLTEDLAFEAGRDSHYVSQVIRHLRGYMWRQAIRTEPGAYLLEDKYLETAVAMLRSRTGVGREWWEPAHDEYLTFLVGNYTVAEITERLNHRFKTRRSIWAVQHRICDLGLSSRVLDYSCDELARMLGVGGVTVRRWISTGLLVARECEPVPGARSRRWRISKESVEAFLDTRQDRYDVALIRDKRLREYARARKRTELTIPQMVALTGIHRSTLIRWCEDGRIPARRQKGFGKYGRWLVEASAARLVRELAGRRNLKRWLEQESKAS